MPVADGHGVPDFGWSPLAVVDSPQDAEDGSTWRHPQCARLRCRHPARYLVNRTRICRWMGRAGSSMTAYAPTLIRSRGRDKRFSIPAIGDPLDRLVTDPPTGRHATRLRDGVTKLRRSVTDGRMAHRYRRLLCRDHALRIRRAVSLPRASMAGRTVNVAAALQGLALDCPGSGGTVQSRCPLHLGDGHAGRQLERDPAFFGLPGRNSEIT
jgi:hypothetical protein